MIRKINSLCTGIVHKRMDHLKVCLKILQHIHRYIHCIRLYSYQKKKSKYSLLFETYVSYKRYQVTYVSVSGMLQFQSVINCPKQTHKNKSSKWRTTSSVNREKNILIYTSLWSSTAHSTHSQRYRLVLCWRPSPMIFSIHKIANAAKWIRDVCVCVCTMWKWMEEFHDRQW